ncbi:MAG: hypothetical protein J6X07_00435 [Prevotella sp.]|nr:hypothetical protein [Prevotella sp.]
MGKSISYHLLQTLKRGAERLSDEARQQVCHYVLSQRDKSEAFMNRGRRVDLYYTLFGWMLCYALGISSDGVRRKAYLAAFDMSRLNELYQTVMTLCQMLDRLLSLPRFTPDAVLRLMADDEPLRRFFESYQRHGSGGGTNAWSARLMMVDGGDAVLVQRLLAVQHESGGFLAHESAPMPDLLSTAVALFALSQQHVSLPYDVHPFIEAHWQKDGSFVATLLDEYGDVEYVFYGLLAIGSI